MQWNIIHPRIIKEMEYGYMLHYELSLLNIILSGKRDTQNIVAFYLYEMSRKGMSR